MAAAPGLKVYGADGVYQGAVKDAVLAAVLVDFLGDGASVRLGHSKRSTLYVQGTDGKAGDSWDAAVETMLARMPVYAQAAPSHG